MNSEALNREVSKAAISVTNSWPGVMEADDLAQDIWIKILESPKYQEQMEVSDPALRMEFLKRLGMQLAGREVSAYELFSGNVYYGTDHVRALLESGMLTVTRRDLGDMKETLTDFIDLQDAFKHMKQVSAEYAQIIWSQYVEGNYDSGTGAKYERLRRATISLTDQMNQVHRRRYAEHEDGLGTREIMSNARSRAISSTQWDGPRVR